MDTRKELPERRGPSDLEFPPRLRGSDQVDPDPENEEREESSPDCAEL